MVLRHGTVVNGAAARFACLDPAVYPDGTVEVKLVVMGQARQQHILHLGDTFPVRDQIWKLDRVENPGEPKWLVYLVRVA
jgi:hypothetical protein